MNKRDSSSNAVAVIMTLYRRDPLDQFECAVASIEVQDVRTPIHIYLCVDGPLPKSHETWLTDNLGRFFRVLRNEENIGLARSLNRLIDALGDEEFVFRMDGDDISKPGRFAKQIELMRSDERLGVVGCQAEDIDNDGTIIATRKYPTDPRQVKAMLSRITPILHPAFCIRRAILRSPDIRYPDAYLCEDLAFLVVVARAGITISNHPDTLFQWRTGADFFLRRRSVKRGWSEMRWYLAALGDAGQLVSPKVIYPIARFVLRCMPGWIMKTLYKSNIRNNTLKLR